ncbi:hypothetical protein SEPCBS119000_005401 [Sporothrix epigloea]|uniref:Uncharacterized protein n=1 Tax=Sporothrix epigloea TaxID=1892477 RepID=A0ABP0DXE9_9PEZI
MSIDAIMHSDAPKSPTFSTRSTRNHDTGFPLSFCGSGNTTWRHPEADTSPNACISSNDIAVERLYSRSRRSFMQSKNKRMTLGHGKLTKADLEAYSELPSLAEMPRRANVSTSSSFSSHKSRFSADGGPSTSVAGGGGGSGLNEPNGANAGVPCLQANTRQPDASHSGTHSSVLRKLRLHN